MAEDLTKQKFNYLKPLYRVENKQKKFATWICQCDCGNYVLTTSGSLKKGSITSCGCQRGKNRIKDIASQQYGDIKVLSQTDLRTKGGSIIWQCECLKCHQIINISANNIKNHMGGCGQCFSGKDITNQRFGKLVAKKYAYTDNNKKSIWLCECDCGNKEVYIASNSLLAGKTQSCGCLRSKGEEKISFLLQENNFSFVKEKTFEDCRYPETNYPARFDFYVNNSYLIEYDGIQHFNANGGWNDKKHFNKTQEQDAFKNEYCKKNKIPLIRIPYYHLDKLEVTDLVLETSNFLTLYND